MSEEEKKLIDGFFNKGWCCDLDEVYNAVMKLEDLYQKEKEKYKRLSIEAQATAFDDQNKDTEGLLRVLLKQGEITLDEKGYYQREDFDWEENLYKLGLMKKKEKGFYIPDDECLDEYTKQLENQLKEYNEIKETFRKYCVMDNDTLYDGCCKMQDEIDELKEKNKELDSEIIRTRATLNEITKDYISIDKIIEKIEDLKDVIQYSSNPLAIDNSKYCIEILEELLEESEKYYHVVKSNELEEEINNAWVNKINEKIEEYEEILQSSIIKEDYKKEVEHIIRVLEELKGDN